MVRPGPVIYLRTLKDRWPHFFRNVTVLEIGSLTTTVDIQEIFEESWHMQIDADLGKDVKIVQKCHEPPRTDASFDIVISTNRLATNTHCRKIINNGIRLLRPGGLFVLLYAGSEKPEHVNASPEPSSTAIPKEAESRPGHDKHLNAADIQTAIDIDSEFLDHEFQVNSNVHDVYFAGILRGRPDARRPALAIHESLADTLRRNEELMTRLDELKAQIEQLTNRLGSMKAAQAATQAVIEKKTARIQRLESTWHQKLAVGLYRATRKIQKRVLP